MVQFGVLHPDGSMTDEREIAQSSIVACLHFILAPEHYRADGGYRCDDPMHSEMVDWGYYWNGMRWW
jgi:hypothetical protein